MDANIFCNNNDNAYLGHGTGTEDPVIIESIMNNGLRCSHGSLYFTTVEFGMGNQIEESISDMLRNWPHKDSKNIIIASIPLKYRILDSTSIGTYSRGDAAYYYNPNQNDSRPYLMPEFIKGYYDANTDTFINNPKYYENLSQEERIRLFDKVKENYFDILNNSCGIDTYREIIEDTPLIFGLTDEEIIEIQKRKQAIDVLAGTKETSLDKVDVHSIIEKINPELLKKNMKLPNGFEIPAKQYIQEVVYPYLPQSGRVTLSNGVNISVQQFLEECVIFDCQDRYNGDIERYLVENTVNTVMNDKYSDKKTSESVDDWDWEQIETLSVDDNDITSSMELREHMLSARQFEDTRAKIESAIKKAERMAMLSNMSEEELDRYFESEIEKTTDPKRLGDLRRELLDNRIKDSDDTTKSSDSGYSGPHLALTPGEPINQKNNNVRHSHNSNDEKKEQPQFYTYSGDRGRKRFDDSSSKKQDVPIQNVQTNDDQRKTEWQKQQQLANELMQYNMDELRRFSEEYYKTEKDAQKLSNFRMALLEVEDRKKQQTIDEQKQNSGQKQSHGMGM